MIELEDVDEEADGKDDKIESISVDSQGDQLVKSVRGGTAAPSRKPTKKEEPAVHREEWEEDLTST